MSSDSDSDSADDTSSVVIDNGSHSIKAGLSGNKSPDLIIPTIIGFPKQQLHSEDCSAKDGDQKDIYVGDEAEANRKLLRIKYPVEHGIVTNWDDMEKVWQYCFNKLKKDSSLQPVHLTEPPINPKANREKMTQLMFESFNCPAMYLSMQPVLSLYASGRVTGVIFDSGSATSHVVPIYEGYGLRHAIIGKNLVGGVHLDWYLSKLLAARSFTFPTYYEEKKIIKDIKETVCYTALDFDKELKSMGSTSDKLVDYKLPDGRTISLGSERIKCPELIFNPTLDNIEVAGIHEHIVNSIRKCDPDIKTTRLLYSNIVLAGGSTSFPDIEKRLEKEVLAFSGKTEGQRTCVVAPADRSHSAWLGGSIVSNLSTFQNMYITKEEYDDYGPGIVHKKCF